MLRVGLTGGMSCGKTAVADMFARRGAHVVQADRLAHELMRRGEQVYEEIVQLFGRNILAPDGTIDRVKLAEAVFSPGPEGGTRIGELNAIVHPAVIRRQEEWMDEIGKSDPHAVAIVEAALIFEAGLGERFDNIVVVTCTAEQKIERFARRANLSREAAASELARRSAAQLPDTEKASRAQWVIDNSGSLQETERQVDLIWKKMKEMS